jgi:hypothetical protein
MLWMVAGMAGLLAGIAAVRFLIQPASGLRLTAFRPWRGDAWPRGVQEDDDARFDWDGPAKRRRAAIRLGWEDIVVVPVTGDAGETEAIGLTIEDMADEAVVVEPLEPGHVQRRSH